MTAPALRVVADDLGQLAYEVNAAHRRALSALGQWLLAAREVGELLQQVKAALPHGRYLPWVKENCDFTWRHARRYVLIARHWPEIEWKAKAEGTRVSSLSLRACMRLIAGKKMDDDLPEPKRAEPIACCPACGHEGHQRDFRKPEYQKIYVHFATWDDVEDFSKRTGKQIEFGTHRITWP